MYVFSISKVMTICISLLSAHVQVHTRNLRNEETGIASGISPAKIMIFLFAFVKARGRRKNRTFFFSPTIWSFS